VAQGGACIVGQKRGNQRILEQYRGDTHQPPGRHHPDGVYVSECESVSVWVGVGGCGCMCMCVSASVIKKEARGWGGGERGECEDGWGWGVFFSLLFLACLPRVVRQQGSTRAKTERKGHIYLRMRKDFQAREMWRARERERGRGEETEKEEEKREKERNDKRHHQFAFATRRGLNNNLTFW
jgi:hypothetical protein